MSDEALLVHIKAIHTETRGSYGWPHIWRELVERGMPVEKERGQKLMQCKRLHGQCFATRRHAKDETIAWLLWCNKTRLYSTLAYVSPMQFEHNGLAAQARKASS